MKNDILKTINREIVKCAKKGELHYYWDITGLSKILVAGIISDLEKEGRTVKSKGENYKIIYW